MTPDPVCPERSGSDPVNIRPDPKPCCKDHFCFAYVVCTYVHTYVYCWPRLLIKAL